MINKYSEHTVGFEMIMIILFTTCNSNKYCVFINIKGGKNVRTNVRIRVIEYDEYL